ncbi:MAG: ATP-binding protein [Candidatus Bathyarchaeia archaeon]
MALHIFNPWWKGKEYLGEDEDYRKWEESKIKWKPEILDKILNEENLRSFSLHFIFGPRQVGKTTLLKLMIKNLLEIVDDPEAIFYFRCDGLADYKELGEVIDAYLKIKRNKRIEKSFIFLDEITFPKEWNRAIKLNIDIGNFKNDVLFLTGSLSMYAKREVETFPGRRGHGKDFIFYPISFREFVKIVKPEIIEKIGKMEDFKEEEIREKSLKALPWVDELNELFETYLECGGFPLAIKSKLETNKVSREAMDSYLSWIRGDVARLKRNESITKRIAKAIIEKAPSTINYYSLAKEFEIKSHKTVFQHIDMLEKLFVAKVLYYIDLNKLTEVFYKQRKIHLADPFLYKIFSYWCLTEMPAKPTIVESIVASHLTRKFSVGYWKDREEIDTIAFNNAVCFGVEVKYKEKVEARRLKIGKTNFLITLSKSNFNDEPLIVPVSVFLILLEV